MFRIPTTETQTTYTARYRVTLHDQRSSDNHYEHRTVRRILQLTGLNFEEQTAKMNATTGVDFRQPDTMELKGSSFTEGSLQTKPSPVTGTPEPPEISGQGYSPWS
jgi:hypothetical protein